MNNKQICKFCKDSFSKGKGRLKGDLMLLTCVSIDVPKASILKAGRVVFNICGNKYRLITHINYLRQWVFIRFIGTHNDYDKINAEKI